MRGLGLGLGFGRPAGGPSLIAIPAPAATVDENVTDFVTGWVPTGITQDTVANGDYAGTGLADRTRSDVSVGVHGTGRTGVAVLLGTPYTADLILKPDGRTFVLFQIAGAGLNHYGIFDLTTNTLGDSLALTSGTVTNLSNGWKFIRMQFTAAAAALHGCNIYHAINSTTFSMAGDITKGLLLDRYRLSH